MDQCFLGTSVPMSGVSVSREEYPVRRDWPVGGSDLKGSSLSLGNSEDRLQSLVRSVVSVPEERVVGSARNRIAVLP